MTHPTRRATRGLWRKAKSLNRQEFVIVGWSNPEGSRPYLGALLLGYYADDGKLIYAGRVGTGMPDKVLADLRRRLDPLTRQTPPLNILPPRKTRFGSPRSAPLSSSPWPLTTSFACPSSCPRGPKCVPQHKEPENSVDICLCLYGVLNHLLTEDLSTVFGEVARVTKGKFVATVRAIGSTPTIYVDGVKAAKAYHQDNVHGRLEVEFQNGIQTSFPSHLFSAAEIRALAKAALEVEELSGLDLFHNRFATDPDWNPAEATPDANFVHALRVLEHRFRRNPTLLDHATHLLLIARPKTS